MKPLNELYIRFSFIIFFVMLYIGRAVMKADTISKILMVIFCLSISLTGSLFITNFLIAFKKWWRE